MMDSPLITFIIPTIGRPTIDRSVNSIISQTNPNWRCYVIFDGIPKRDFDDPRVTSLSIDKKGRVGPNNGQSGLVRNVGIKMSDTEWVGFLDDDDTIHSDYVKTLSEKYQNKDFVIWRMKYINGLVLPMVGNNEIRFGQVGISFCFKNKFENLIFDSNRDGEDFDLIVKLRSLTDNYVVAPEIYYNVRH